MKYFIEENFNPNKWYSLNEAKAYTQVKSREILTLHIRNGFLKAKEKGTGTGKRYLIKGTHLLEYVTMYACKKSKYSRFSKVDGPFKLRKNYEKYSNPPRGK